MSAVLRKLVPDAPGSDEDGEGRILTVHYSWGGWSAGETWEETPDLPALEDVPFPEALSRLWWVGRPRPTPEALADGFEASLRLWRKRPGAWVESPQSGRRYAVFPTGFIQNVPDTVSLPKELKLHWREDVLSWRARAN